jgi:hypothetical protein
MKNKNIWLIPSNAISRLFLDYYNNLFIVTTKDFITKINKFQNIYITSDEEIKEGDWFLEDDIENLIFQRRNSKVYSLPDSAKKIILTTDVDLIKDGVQAIDDEFLEWFVKNPSCESVKVDSYKTIYHNWIYKIITPKEEHKQVLTEEDIFNQKDIDAVTDYINKEQQKQALIDMMKSDEELGLYDETLRKQFPANIEGSEEFNEMCKEDFNLTKVDILELMRRAYNAGYTQYNIVEAGLEGKDTEENVRWILTKYQTEKSANAKRKRNFYCGDKVDYDEQCLEQCDRCVDCTGVDYGYYDENQ